MAVRMLRAEYLERREVKVTPTPSQAVPTDADYSKPLTRAQIQRMRDIAAEEKRTGTWVTYTPES